MENVTIKVLDKICDAQNEETLYRALNDTAAAPGGDLEVKHCKSSPPGCWEWTEAGRTLGDVGSCSCGH